MREPDAPRTPRSPPRNAHGPSAREPKSRHLTRPLVELGARAVGCQRARAPARSSAARSRFAPRMAARSPARSEHRLGSLPQLERIGCVGVELERREQVRGDDLDELVVALLPLLLEMRGRRQMPRLALLARERLVRHLAQEILEEAELPRSGDRGSTWSERTSFRTSAASSVSRSPSPEPDTAASAALLKVLPSTAASWTTERSSAGRPSRRAAISAWRVSGTSSASIGPVGRYSSSTCSSRPRSMSMRTVSTA